MSILKGLFKDKKLEAEFEELNKKYDFLKEAFAKLTGHRENLETELKSYELLKVKFQKKDQEFKSLKLYFEKQQEELINFRVVKRDSERELGNLKTEQERLKVELSKKELLELENKEQKLKISSLKEELSKLKIEVDDLKINKENERLRRLNLESDLENLKKEKEALKVKNSEKELLEVKNKEQKLVIENLEEKFINEEAEKNRLLKEFSKISSEEKKLREELSDSKRKLVNLRMDKASEIIEREKIEKEKEDLKVQISKKALLELENKEQKLVIENLEEKFINEEAEKNRLLKEFLKISSEEKNLKEELSKLKREVDDLKKNKENERLNLESDLESLKREKSKLEDDLEEKRKIKILYDQLASKVDELKKENKELKLKVDERKQPKEEEKRIVENLQIKIENLELEKKLEKFDCLNYEDYLINKENLNNYLLRFSEEDFRKILSLSREKNIFNALEERQLLNIITWLKFNTPLEKLNVEKLKELYIKFMEKYYEKEITKSPALKIAEKLEEEKNILPEVKAENRNNISLVSGWISYDNYISNKNDLIPLLKTFTENDFKEIFLEGKKRKIIKPSQERDFSNILTRLKLKLPIIDMSLEKIETFYELLMNEIHKKKLESSKNIEKIEVEEGISKDEEDFFEIENYTAKDWYKLYELSKNDRNISEWLRKYILKLSKYVQNNLNISQNEYKVITNNYGILYPLMKKIKDIPEKEIVTNTKEVLKVDLIMNEKQEIQEKENINIIENMSFYKLQCKGLKTGFVEMDDLKKIDYGNDPDAYDIYEAIEMLEERGIRISY